METFWIEESRKVAAGGDFPTLILTRPGYEADLRAELSTKSPQGAGVKSGIENAQHGKGWVLLPHRCVNPAPYIFERQRLPGARLLTEANHGEMARQTAAWIAPMLRDGSPWHLQAFATAEEKSGAEGRRVAALGTALLNQFEAEYPRIHKRHTVHGGAAGWVVQIAGLGKEIRVSAAPASALTSSHPGGLHRMQMEPGAPSRSFLKIEEALERFGELPRPSQKVVDLGAAPGGWSYAFLRRGCRVTAVDRGRMKLKDIDFPGHRLEYLPEDGLKYRPPDSSLPVDWLVSDMLIPPGVTLGLLRKWAGRGWMRRFIVNIKLPQKEAYPALRPIEAFLADATGGDFSLRQLYHDRREVTAWGRIAQSARNRPTRRGSGSPASKSAKPRKGKAATGKPKSSRRRR